MTATQPTARLTPRTTATPAAPGLVLATDLDGTFLGGPEPARRALYDALAARSDAMLVFVTGRDLAFIRRLLDTPGMPRPDYVIGDVGTTVVDGREFAPVEPIQAEIRHRWNDAGERVRQMLADEPGLTLQPTPFECRVSYWYEPGRLRPTTVSRIEEAGFDCLTSADTFLDVLPRGIAKGPTLTRLVETAGLPAARVLVAGDTLNDLSLFRTGYRGVAVGNAEPKLLAALRGNDTVYLSPHPGAAGIADAITHFGLHGGAE